MGEYTTVEAIKVAPTAPVVASSLPQAHSQHMTYQKSHQCHLAEMKDWARNMPGLYDGGAIDQIDGVEALKFLTNKDSFK